MNETTITTETMTATPVPIETDERSNSTRNGLICALIVAACVWIVYPVANMPFGDDFSYTKTALDFARTGHLLYNGWATAMLGWMVPWGALFIKIFGFSFTAVRFSMLPVDMATVYLFHAILRRFGVNPGNAILGALTMSLSPLFLPLAATYMTDVPGLFVILLCIYMCQRAVAAPSDRTALVWLCSAMLVNVAGGTVRQIAWLGALVMVPSTAWLLRQRRGMKTAGILLWICSFIGVLACLHWFNRQSYSVPEHVFMGPIHIRMLIHMAAEILRTFLCLLLVIFPVSVAWLPLVRQLTPRVRLRISGAIAVLVSVAIVLYKCGRSDTWLIPWLVPILETEGLGGVKVWMKIAVSLLVIAPAFIFLEQITTRKQKKLDRTGQQHSSWQQLAWILGPFTLSYILLLVPSATYVFIQDRYLLGLIPAAMIVLLRLYQERVTTRLSTISVVTLTVFAVYAIGGAHSLFAGCRALVKTVQMVQSSGVPRKSIRAGMASDGWTQVEKGEHINDPRIQIPAGAYNPNTPDLDLPGECTFWFASLSPSITPKYFVVNNLLPCFARTKYPPVHYTTWLPPFHRLFYVQQLNSSFH